MIRIECRCRSEMKSVILSLTHSAPHIAYCALWLTVHSTSNISNLVNWNYTTNGTIISTLKKTQQERIGHRSDAI